MAIKTISKNGKRVPASEKGKEGKKAKAPKPPKAATAPKQRRRTAAQSSVVTRPKESPPEPGKPIPLWDRLEKPWSITDCRRQIAIAVRVNEAQSKLHNLKEQRKYLRGELERDGLTDAEEKKLAQKLWHCEHEIAQEKQTVKAATADLLRIPIESVGGTLFQPPDEPSPNEDDDADPKLFPNGAEHFEQPDGSLTRSDAPAVDKSTGEVLDGTSGNVEMCRGASDDGKDAPTSPIKVAEMTLSAETKAALANVGIVTVKDVADYIEDGGDLSLLAEGFSDLKRLHDCAKPFLPEPADSAA